MHRAAVDLAGDLTSRHELDADLCGARAGRGHAVEPVVIGEGDGPAAGDGRQLRDPLGRIGPVRHRRVGVEVDHGPQGSGDAGLYSCPVTAVAPRMLMVHASSDLYGSDLVCLRVARGARAAGWDVVATVPGDGPLVPELRRAGVTPLFTTTASVTTYNDTGLSASTTYYYQVKATNTAGDLSSLAKNSGLSPRCLPISRV